MERIKIEDIKGPVYITPMSSVALLVYHMLKERDVEIQGFCDRDLEKIGKRYDGCPVLDREKTVSSMRSGNTFIVVSRKFWQEIGQELKSIGVQNIIYAQQFMEANNCFNSKGLEAIDETAADGLVWNPQKSLIEGEALSEYCNNIEISRKYKKIRESLILFLWDRREYEDILERAYEEVDYIQNLCIYFDRHTLDIALYAMNSIIEKNYPIGSLIVQCKDVGIDLSKFESYCHLDIPFYEYDSSYERRDLLRNRGEITSFSGNIGRILLEYDKRWFTHSEVTSKCIFTHIPKNVGSSMSKFLRPIRKRVNMHVRLLRYKQEDEKLFRECFKFAIVRNPWDRLVSVYHFRQIHWNKLGYNLLSEEEQFLIRKQDPAFASSFREMILSFEEKIPDVSGKRFLISQHRWICDDEGNALTDFIGRFENLEEDSRYIASKVGLCSGSSIPHVNISKHRDYRDYYDDETLEIVRKVYKKDIEIFGYDFE